MWLRKGSGRSRQIVKCHENDKIDRLDYVCFLNEDSLMLDLCCQALQSNNAGKHGYMIALT
jgi:hypothetical protein